MALNNDSTVLVDGKRVGLDDVQIDGPTTMTVAPKSARARVEYFAGSGERVPALMTKIEAARYLRFDVLHDDDDGAVRALERLVEKGLIRPCMVGGRRFYARRELDRFLADRTASYGPG